MAKRILLSLVLAVLGCGCALKTGGSLWQIDDASTEPEPDIDDTAVDVPDDPDAADDGPEDPVFDPDVTDPVSDDGIPDITPEDGLLCEPGVTWCPDGNTLATCNGEGTGFETVPCHLGCGGVPTPHCLALVPSNVTDDSLLCVPGATDFAPSAGIRYVHVNTNTGQIMSWDSEWNFLGDLRGEGDGLINGINFIVVDQTSGGPRLAVFSVASMTLNADVDLYATGENAMVFFSCGDVTVAGVLQAGADVYTGTVFRPGPAGGASEAGDGRGNNGESLTGYVSGGGGGGGFGGPGGSGSGANSSGGSGGPAYGNMTLIPLLGGSGGGSGADNSGDWGGGGPAGGALQVSTPGTITVLANGVIESNGERGLGGHADGGGGGGGGSGGGVLLEAHTISVQAGGLVVVNGGGAGSGGLYSSNWGNHGTRGLWSLQAAAGGASPAAGACAGAAGNSAVSIGGAALSCTDTNGGGGGGGAGRIRLNAVLHELAPDTLSPALSAVPTTTTTGPLDLR